MRRRPANRPFGREEGVAVINEVGFRIIKPKLVYSY
jgi:hypothetical protein